jgi:hypothetical protein
MNHGWHYLLLCMQLDGDEWDFCAFSLLLASLKSHFLLRTTSCNARTPFGCFIQVLVDFKSQIFHKPEGSVGTHHPVPQWALVVPQNPPALQHWLLKSPPLHVKPPFPEPQLPSTEGMLVVMHELEEPLWLLWAILLAMLLPC